MTPPRHAETHRACTPRSSYRGPIAPGGTGSHGSGNGADPHRTTREQHVAQASGGSTRPTPRAPLPRRVYLVRRLVVLVALLLVVALVVWWLVGRGSSSSADAGTTATATSTATGGTTRETEDSTDDPKGDETQEAQVLDDDLSELERAARAAGVAVCRADDLDVDFEATAPSYAGAEQPAFRITVTSRLDDACLFEAGDANRRISVTSGDDLIWSSTHCQGEPESRPLLLGPGVPSEETYTWARVRSQKGCDPVPTAPGAGTYTAKLQLDDEVVGKAVFDLR